TVSVNPQGEVGGGSGEQLRMLVPSIDLLLLNDRERESLGRVDGPLVVVKHGAEGAAAHSRDGVVRVAGHPVEVVDTTGAGDSFERAAAGAQTGPRSSLSVAGADQGLTEFYEHGAAVTLEEWRGFAELAARHVPRAGWATISGSLPPGAPADGYVPLIEVARS